MLVSKLHGKLVGIFWTFSISCCSVVMLIFLSLLVFLGVGLLRNYHVVFYFSLLFDRYVGVSPQSKGFLVMLFHLTILCTFVLNCHVSISDTLFPCHSIVLLGSLTLFAFLVA